MSDAMSSVQAFFDSPFGTAIKAILLLVLAFAVAAIAKSLIEKLLMKTRLADPKYSVKTAGGKEQSVISLIAKLCQLIVFLLFVPGIFEILGITQVATPIVSMLNIMLAYIPNILGCIVVLWVGFYAARLVRDLLVPVFDKIQVNKLQSMAGIEVNDSGKLSNTLAYLVYVLILIPVIIAALYVLNIKAITNPAVAMLGTILNYIPNILAALIIIMVGYVLAKFIGNIVTRLIAASGLDAKVAALMDNKNPKYTLSEVVGKILEVVLVVFFVVESFSALRLGVLTRIGVAVIAYLPEVLVACLILLACIFVAAVAGKALEKDGKKGMAVIAKTLIYVVGGFMILNELGIARTLVDSTYMFIIAAIAVAFAISFGIGGRDFARKCLAVLEQKLGLNKSAAAVAADADQAAQDADAALKAAVDETVKKAD